MREIVFDTETTGLNPAGGDRMVEIGCVEIYNRVETGLQIRTLDDDRLVGQHDLRTVGYRDGGGDCPGERSTL